jgi:hypothetical protein
VPQIPATINGVTVDFGPQVNPDVDHRIVEALRVAIRRDVAPGQSLDRIYVSSANDQHQPPSRHMQGAGKAVDISRINGQKMILAYPGDASVKAIVDAIQTELESYAHRRENFGPAMKKKLGADYAIGGHADHIHFSVN